MKTITTFFGVFFIIITCFSQPVIQWEKSFGGSGNDGLSSFQHTSDEGYIVVGYSNSNDGDVTGNHGGFDVWIVKINATGVIEWQKSIGGSLDEAANAIQQTLDGGYIIAGYSNSNDGDVTGNHGGRDFWIVKMNTAGTIEWQKSLGGSLDDTANDIQQTSDGGYIVAGESSSNDGDVTGNKGIQDFWIVKLGSNGILEWQKSLGGSSRDTAETIQQTSDGGYIVAGSTFSNNGDVTGNHGAIDNWVVKLTVSGNIEWERATGGQGEEWCWSILETLDGGFILAADSNNANGDVTENFGGRDFWIVKFTDTGLIDWQKSYGGGFEDSPTSIQHTTDGGYIVSGFSGSNDGDVSGNQGSLDFWIIKINATGTLEWQKSLGGSNYDMFSYALQVSDNDYIVAGTTFSDDGDVSVNKGISDFWIVKLTPFLAVDDIDLSNTISLYPNPNNGQFYLDLSSLKAVSSISIVDILGRLVYSYTNISPGTVEISQNLAAGMYVVTVRSGVSETNLKMIVK